MLYSPKIDKLITAFKCLPGVGNKTAQRMAFYLLEKKIKEAKYLSDSINDAIENIKTCKLCNTLTEEEICHICNHPKRESNILCIVESPSDVIAIEQSGCYRGLYFVLMGHLSPIDGIGPDDIGIPNLINRLATKQIAEVILATNSTVEGEATAFYISEILKKYNIKASRIAHGIPMGGELEYIDSNTITQAINKREIINSHQT